MKKNSNFFADIEMKKPQQKPRYVNIYRHIHTHIFLLLFCSHFAHMCTLQPY